MEESLKIYCKNCESITEHRQKGLRDTVNICNTCDTTNMPVTLMKTNGEVHYGTQAKFVEWSEEELGSIGKQLQTEPQIGFSCIIDDHYGSQYTWLTTPITEIIELGWDLNSIWYQFKTKNSDYKLYITKL